jgi:hypothetical protein
MVKETRKCFRGEERLVKVTDSSSGEQRGAGADQGYLAAKPSDRKELAK